MPTTSSDHLHRVGNPNPDADEWDGCAAGDIPAELHMELVVRLVRIANEVLLVYPA